MAPRKWTRRRIANRVLELIPEGVYCHGRESWETVCPFWRSAGKDAAYCLLLDRADSTHADSLLWDQCKECGINDEW